MNDNTEYWLRGAVADIIPLLQPVAHALLQARKEINEFIHDFPDEVLWEQPAGVASPAFHLQHITGVLQRLFAYADGKQLNNEQLNYLASEGKQRNDITVSFLLQQLNKQVDAALLFLKKTSAETLIETRYVGRKQTPSTQLGLLFHAAEHTMRHTGQLMVTVKVILNNRTAIKKE